MNFVVATPKPFYNAVETGDHKHMGEYIAEGISMIIERLGADKAFAPVTDNASNMNAAQTIVHQRYTSVATVGCCTHGQNLLLSDMLKVVTLQEVHKKSISVIRHIKNPHVTVAHFAKKQEEC